MGGRWTWSMAHQSYPFINASKRFTSSQLILYYYRLGIKRATSCLHTSTILQSTLVRDLSPSKVSIQERGVRHLQAQQEHRHDEHKTHSRQRALDISMGERRTPRTSSDIPSTSSLREMALCVIAPSLAAPPRSAPSLKTSRQSTQSPPLQHPHCPHLRT